MMVATASLQASVRQVIVGTEVNYPTLLSGYCRFLEGGAS